MDVLCPQDSCTAALEFLIHMQRIKKKKKKKVLEHINAEKNNLAVTSSKTPTMRVVPTSHTSGQATITHQATV